MNHFRRPLLSSIMPIVFLASLSPGVNGDPCVPGDIIQPRFDHEAMCTDGSVFTAYIDPRSREGGLTVAVVIFTEPVYDVGSTQGGTQPGTLTASAFTLTETSGAIPPTVLSAGHLDGDHSVVLIQWDRPITLQEWTTIIARVEDACGNIIPALPDFGPGILERNRVDIGFLPCDFDQSGDWSPFDLLYWIQWNNGIFEPECLDMLAYFDFNRNGFIDPFDMLQIRLECFHDPPGAMNHPQP